MNIADGVEERVRVRELTADSRREDLDGNLKKFPEVATVEVHETDGFGFGLFLKKNPTRYCRQSWPMVSVCSRLNMYDKIQQGNVKLCQEPQIHCSRPWKKQQAAFPSKEVGSHV